MKISPALLAPFIHVAYRLWCRSLRISESGRDQAARLESSGNVIMFPVWHDELFLLTHMCGDLRLVTIVSQSADGDYLARLQTRMGIKTIRGSSSRGGVKALLQAASFMRKDRYHCCITVDGPRGPRRVAKPGAVILAFRSSAYILPVRVFMKHRKCFASWDRFQLPWPFTRVHVAWGQPYRVEIADLSDDSLRRECAKLESQLHALHPPEGF